MKIFISGPMTDIAEFNRPMFNQVADELTTEGHTVLNPAVLPDGLQHEEYMVICMAMLSIADEVVMLPGWLKSKGAVMEYDKALETHKRVTVYGTDMG